MIRPEPFHTRLEQAGAPHGMPDIETLADCVQRQSEMLRRLEKTGALGPLTTLARCDEGDCWAPPCRDGCHFAQLRLRRAMIPQAVQALKTHPGPVWMVTIVHPNWVVPVGKLDRIPMEAAAQWVRRRLASVTEGKVLGIGSFEACLNVDQEGGETWAGQIHLMVSGPERNTLKKALYLDSKSTDLRYGKRVQVKAVGDLVRQTAYSMKRYAERRIAYVDSQGRQNQRHLPLMTKPQVEFDRWLLSMKIGSRLVLVGCRRHGKHVLCT